MHITKIATKSIAGISGKLSRLAATIFCLIAAGHVYASSPIFLNADDTRTWATVSGPTFTVNDQGQLTLSATVTSTTGRMRASDTGNLNVEAVTSTTSHVTFNPYGDIDINAATTVTTGNMVLRANPYDATPGAHDEDTTLSCDSNCQTFTTNTMNVRIDPDDYADADFDADLPHYLGYQSKEKQAAKTAGTDEREDRRPRFAILRIGANLGASVGASVASVKSAVENYWPLRVLGQRNDDDAADNQSEIGYPIATLNREPVVYGLLEPYANQLEIDTGHVVDLEIYSPKLAGKLVPGNTNLRGFVFYDQPQHDNKPLDDAVLQDSLAAMGAGVRWDIDQNLNMRFDVSRVTDEGHYSQEDDVRGYITIYFEF